MEKLKNATKRIAAVGASALMLSSAAFAGSLGDYPNNFVKDGKFDGQVVVGSAAQSIDSTSATSIIDDLKSQFSGDTEQVKISYKKSASGSEEVSFSESGDTWNFGEANDDVRTSAFDEGDSSSVLSDDLTFDNGLSDEDYSQEISFDTSAMTFEHTLRDEHSDEITTHIFMDNGDNNYIMRYSLELDGSLDDVNANNDDSDFIGEVLEVLGNEYTITDITDDATKGITKLVLIGGSNKISLGEGETTTVTIDGDAHEISVQSVSATKVLLTVDGQSTSIDNYESEDIAGITIAVTDLVESSRDAVKGYCEIVLGGHEIILEDGQEVKIDGEDISDVYEDYKVTATFNGATDDWTGFDLDYSTDDSDGILLEAGDSWEEKVFDAFSVSFDGTNDVDYTVAEVKASGDKVSLEGEVESGDDFNSNIAHAVDDTDANPAVRLIGADEDTPFLLADVDFAVVDNNIGSVEVATTAATTTPIVNNAGADLTDTTDYIVYRNADATEAYAAGTDSILYVGTGAEIEALFSLANGTTNIQVNGVTMTAADSGMRFIAGDVDGQAIYEVASYDTSDDETSIDEVYSGSSVTENKANDDVASKLDDITTFNVTSDVFVELDADFDATFDAELAFATELTVDLTDVSNALTSSASIAFDYDEADLDVDTTGDGAGFTTSLSWDTTDDEFVLGTPTDDGSGSGILDFGSGTEQDTKDGDDDVQQYVSTYGTLIEYDNDEGSYVKISTPDEQVEAEVSLVFGSGASESGSVTVDSDKVDDKKAELEKEGYTITGTETLASTTVEFGVSAAVVDSDVTGSSDMIVVGGPIVNSVARTLLGVSSYDAAADENVKAEGDAVAMYFSDVNSVLVYGYTGADTAAVVGKLNAGSADFK